MRCYSGRRSAIATESGSRDALVGKLADLVVLGADPRSCEDPAEIAAVPVLATAVGGSLVHRA